MTNTAQLPTDYWQSIDDALGPAAGRYFGTGYKQTGPTIGQVQVRHDAQASRLAGHGSVTGDKLSTTDAVALVTEALVGLVAARYCPEAARETRMTALDLRASAKPLGSPLDDFPVHARLSDEHGGPLTVEASIGNITAVGQVVRPTEASSLVDVDSAERLPSLFGVGEELAYQRRTVALTSVTSRSPAEAEADFEVTADRSGGDEVGEVCFIDAFVGAVQLGQLLLARLDGLDESGSGGLFTRRTSFRVDRPLRTSQRSLLHTRLGRSRIVRLEGSPWRCADIVAGVGDAMTVTCSVGHRLPDTHQV
ncbi:AvrD family protein [Kribbella sp. NPDC051718]|uniref:AvrD family protein n=1 Tax=Kribbella sp. NPDC051718 TaxID=3155168 RepID=UPI003412308A